MLGPFRHLKSSKLWYIGLPASLLLVATIASYWILGLNTQPKDGQTPLGEGQELVSVQKRTFIKVGRAAKRASSAASTRYTAPGFRVHDGIIVKQHIRGSGLFPQHPALRRHTVRLVPDPDQRTLNTRVV